MFGFGLIIAFGLFLLYLVARAATLPMLAKRFSRRKLAVIGLFLFGVFLVAQIVGHDQTGRLAAALEFVGMTLLGTFFLISTALFIVDLVTLFGWVRSKWTPRLRGFGFVAGIVLSAIALGQGLRAPAVVPYEVALPGLPTELDGKVLVALSDAHLGTQLTEEWFAKRVSEIEALHPDMLVFLGDMVEGHGDTPPNMSALQQLNVPLGKWMVDGNHESHRDDKDKDTPTTMPSAVFEQAGFQRLDNRWAQPVKGLILAGVSDLTQYKRRNLGGDPLGEALANRPQGATILLSHTPWQTDRAANAHVALMLSGHTHGGQIWPFSYLVQQVYPLLAGRYEVGAMTAIVCRGTGTWGPRMRLWQRSEILKITLRAKNSFQQKTAPASSS